MKLYHGSDTYISQIDLDRCTPFKDFGKGFYTTAIVRHATQRAESVASVSMVAPIVTVFDFDENFLEDTKLSVKRFHHPNKEWVEFVIRCRDRRQPQPPHHYDIVEGPVANDKMRTQFALFERGVIDLDTVLQRITYIENTHQISFHTPAATALLKPEPDYPQILIETAVGQLAEYLVDDHKLSIENAMSIVYNSVLYQRLNSRQSGFYQKSPAHLYELLKKEVTLIFAK